MNWPTSQDYNEAVQDAANNFAIAELAGVTATDLRAEHFLV